MTRPPQLTKEVRGDGQKVEPHLTLAPVEAALDLAKFGWSVFPCKADKSPFVRWPVASTTEAKMIHSWWGEADFNVGVDCGKSGLVIIDEDISGAFAGLCRANSQEIPQTYTVSTGRDGGGTHYYFLAPTDHVIKNSTSKIAEGIDIRGFGGYVVAAGSIHTTGRRYEVIVRQEVTALPDWLIELEKVPKLRANKLNGHVGDPMAETTYELPKVIKDGTRDDKLFRFACSLRAKDVPLEEAERKMLAAWKRCEQPPGDPFTEEDALQKLSNAYQQYAAGSSEPAPEPPPPRAKPMTLKKCHTTFSKWMGEDYDLGALDVVLAAAAVEQLDGDPVWLMMVSGSGNAKTETVVALAGAGAHITSSISSEGALLSATSRHERTKDATGGLLRKIGERGLLVIKDFTTIISMSGDARASVLAALREVYDGRWERNVGTDGGKTLTWTGRLVVVGAVTTAYDSAHSVISSMGDRFAVVRIDSNQGRIESGRQALKNVGQEEQMRPELALAAGGVLAQVDPAKATLAKDDIEVLLSAADLVTLARTAAERDYAGNVINTHMPEMPTRFAKMLGQIVRGGLSIGMTHDQALAAACRVASDSVPPLRLSILKDLQERPDSTTTDIRQRLQKPRNTVDRELQALQMIGLVHCDEVTESGWRWSISSDVDGNSLTSLVSRFCCPPMHGTDSLQEYLLNRGRGGTAISGHAFEREKPRIKAKKADLDDPRYPKQNPYPMPDDEY